MTRRFVPERARLAYAAATSYRRTYGRFPNLIFPSTFNEKVQQRKVVDRDPLMPILADKLLVKDFVRQRLGDEWLIPTLWHGTRLPPLAERDWQIPFAIKTTHGSGWNQFVRSDAERDWTAIERKLQGWLATTYGRHAGEWLYGRIEPRLLVEPFIGRDGTLPLDFKFWTFDGLVRFVQVDIGREHNHKRAFYDRDWQRLPFTIEFPYEDSEIEAPASLAAMTAAAELLGRGISFVRVDFYEVDGRPRFGEMTFYPGRWDGALHAAAL
ncbi:MAG: ATP-grasp fold amidoligase family protein [Rhodospirillales bacterium]